MHGGRRHFLHLAWAGTIGAALAHRSPPALARSPVKIGTAVLGDYSMVGPVAVAFDRGFFRQQGLTAEFVPFRGGPDLLKAVIGGEILLGLTGGTDILVFREAGARIKMVATPTDGNHFTLNVRPEIAAVEALRGRALGVTRIGATTWVFARMLARQNGWDPDRDLRIVPLGGFDAQVAALLRDEIQGFIWGDGGAVLEAQGKSRVLMRLDAVTPRWISQIAYAAEAAIDTRAGDIGRALRALFRAMRFMTARPTEAAEIAARTLKWAPNAVLAAHRLSSPLFSKDGRIDPAALRAMQDVLLEQGVLARRLPLEEHYTTAFTPVHP
jgi:NitT/TauT family transport system substrate-binding protein